MPQQIIYIYIDIFVCTLLSINSKVYVPRSVWSYKKNVFKKEDAENNVLYL